MDQIARRDSSSAGLACVRREFEAWREVKASGDRIPAGLWDQAVIAALELGVHRVSRELRLDYAGLKRRVVQRREAGADREAGGASGFVDLGLVQAAMGASYVVEWEKACGQRLRVSVQNGGGVDWERVMTLFSRA